MTSTEKDRIVQLQRQGYGYKRIAAMLDLPVNGVKSFCRRHPVDDNLMPGMCPQCGATVEQVPKRLLSAVPRGGMPIRGWFSEEPTLKESALSVGRHSDCTVEKALIAPVPVLQMQDARG